MGDYIMNAPYDGNAALDMQQEEEKALTRQVMSLKQVVNDMQVIDKTSVEAASNMLLELKDKKKQINDYFKPMVDAAFAAHKAIKARQNEAVQPIEAMENVLRAKVSHYLTAEELKRREEERKARIAAEEAARKERERLLDKAADAAKKGKDEKAEALTQQAEEVYAAPVTVVPEIEKTTRLESGRTVSQKKDIEVDLPESDEGIKELCRAITMGLVPTTVVTFSTAKLKSWAKLNGVTGKHHGCVFRETVGIVTR